MSAALSAMASHNGTLENQLHSAQKNLLFLQQDHAKTLKGLHAEIRRLQQHCTGEHAEPQTELELGPLNLNTYTSQGSYSHENPGKVLEFENGVFQAWKRFGKR